MRMSSSDGKFKAGDGGEIPQDGGVVQGSNDQMRLDTYAINGRHHQRGAV